MDTDSKLLLSWQILHIQELVPILRQCHLVVGVQHNALNIICQSSNVLGVLKSQEQLIATYVYSKLGCNEIYFWIGNNLIWVYNTFNVFAANVDNKTKTMTVTLDKPASTTNINLHPNWVSFEAIAQLISDKLNIEISSEEVEESLEDFGILAARNNGEWGLPKNSLKAYIDKYFESLKKNTFSELIPTSSRRNTKSKASNVVIVESELSTNGNSNNNEIKNIRLPENFADKLMEGRQRKPDIRTGLKLALNEIGGDSENILFMIATNKPQSQQFVAELAEIFKSPNRSIAKATAEIANVAVEMLRSSDAA